MGADRVRNSVIGITGQDGSYLHVFSVLSLLSVVIDATPLCRTELLLEKGYEVHGIIRRSSSFNTGRLHHLYEDQHERMFSFSALSRLYSSNSH